MNTHDTVALVTEKLWFEVIVRFSNKSLIFVLMFIMWFDVQSNDSFSGMPMFAADYVVSRGSIPFSNLRLTLTTVVPNSYLFQSTTEIKGAYRLFFNDKITEESLWQYQQQQITPLKYSYRHSGGRKQRFVELTFDWNKQRVSNFVKGRSWKMDIPVGTLDKLVVQLALMQRLAVTKTDKFQFVVADGGKLKTNNYHVVSHEKITTSLGDFDTVKVLRSKNGKAPDTSLWLAPELHYLPIQIKRKKKDATYHMTLQRLQWEKNTQESLPSLLDVDKADDTICLSSEC